MIESINGEVKFQKKVLTIIKSTHFFTINLVGPNFYYLFWAVPEINLWPVGGWTAKKIFRWVEVLLITDFRRLGGERNYVFCLLENGSNCPFSCLDFYIFIIICKNYFSHLQFGFQEGVSCLEASFVISESIKHMIDLTR